ncbi:MAG: hypothetical protein ACK4GJ_00605 [bacterium]
MSINPQLILNLLPAVINAGQSAAQNLQESYKKQVEEYERGRKELQNLMLQDLQKKREADKKLFETIKSNNNSNRLKNQESLASSWAQALGTNSLGESNENIE